MHKIIQVQVPKYPVLRITFDDGMVGDIDLRDEIATKPMFAELKGKVFFNQVALRDNGYSLGWKLDHVFEEIDFSADGLRTDIETQLVRQAAARYRAKLKAAE